VEKQVTRIWSLSTWSPYTVSPLADSPPPFKNMLSSSASGQPHRDRQWSRGAGAGHPPAPRPSRGRLSGPSPSSPPATVSTQRSLWPHRPNGKPSPRQVQRSATHRTSQAVNVAPGPHGHGQPWVPPPFPRRLVRSRVWQVPRPRDMNANSPSHPPPWFLKKL